MASEIRVNQIQNRSGLTTTTFSDTGVDIVGVATAFNFKTGTTNVHNVGVEAAGINVLGADTPIGTGSTIYDDGGARFSGVVTATSFSGSGANLTGITGTTINNNANNRIITGSGTANTLEAESGLTFDGSTINFTAASGDARLTLIGTEGNDARISLVADDGDDHIDQWNLRAEAANHFAIDQFASGSFVERFTIGSDAANGDVTVKTGNLIIGTNGKGIDFSAVSNGQGGSHQLLDDYEDGSYTANFEVTSGSVNFSQNTLHYTKIGNICYVNGEIATNATGYSSPGGQLRFDLPFTSSNAAGYAGYARGIVGAIWSYYAPSNPHGNYGWYPLHAHIGNNQSTDVILYIVGYNGTNSNWGPIGNLVGNSAQIPISFTYRTA